VFSVPLIAQFGVKTVPPMVSPLSQQNGQRRFQT